MSHRSSNRLMMDLLAAIRDQGPAGVSRLLLVANTTHGKLKGLLATCEQRGWVQAQRDGARSTWTITPRGEGVLADLRRVDAVMQDYGLGL